MRLAPEEKPGALSIQKALTKEEFYLFSYLQDGGAAYKMVVGDYGSGKPHVRYCMKREKAAILANTALDVFLDVIHRRFFVKSFVVELPRQRFGEERTIIEAATVAIYVATLTLESRIDIGSVDQIVFVGARPDLTSFQQRSRG